MYKLRNINFFCSLPYTAHGFSMVKHHLVRVKTRTYCIHTYIVTTHTIIDHSFSNKLFSGMIQKSTSTFMYQCVLNKTSLCLLLTIVVSTSEIFVVEAVIYIRIIMCEVTYDPYTLFDMVLFYNICLMYQFM